jgi:hypothetical protein
METLALLGKHPGQRRLIVSQCVLDRGDELIAGSGSATIRTGRDKPSAGSQAIAIQTAGYEHEVNSVIGPG